MATDRTAPPPPCVTPDAIQKFLAAVAALKFEEEPNYAALRAILQAGLKSLGNPPVKLVFTGADTVRNGIGAWPSNAFDWTIVTSD